MQVNNRNSNAVEVTAKCTYVGPIETFSSGFKKRTIVLEWQNDGDKFPTKLAFILKKEQADSVNGSLLEKMVHVRGCFSSREWTNPKNGNVQFFTELTAFSATIADDAPSSSAEPEVVQADEIDDLPF